MYWEESDNPTTMYLKRNFAPVCHLCNVEMEWRIAKHFKLDPHSHHEDEYAMKSEATARAVDCEFVCPSCHQWDVFGVAVTPAHYGRIMEFQRKAFEAGQKINFERENES